MLSVLEKIGCKIEPDSIEDCHRLSKNSDNVIIKFSRRNDCEHVLRVKEDLRNLNLEDLGFHGENKIYKNRGLCQYYRMLWSKSKKLHSMDRIHCFYIAGESIKIKVHENSTPLAIKHVNGFEYHFPDVDLSPTFFKFWIMNAIQCCFLCLLFFSCIVLSLFVFLMCLSFEG